MPDFIKENIVPLILSLSTAFSYVVTVVFYFFQYLYYGIPINSFSPSLSQVVCIMFIVLFAIVIFAIIVLWCVKSSEVLEEKKLSFSMLCVIVIMSLITFVVFCLFVKTEIVIIAVIIAVLLYSAYDSWKKQNNPEKAFILAIASFLLFLSLTIVSLSITFCLEKTEYLKLRNENYLLVQSSSERDIYKEYDFEKGVFIDNFKFISLDKEIELEKVKIKK